MEITEYIIEKAKELSKNRMRAYEWMEDHKYEHNTFRSNVIGSIGEICTYEILKKMGIRCRRLYYKFTGYDMGDIQVGDLFLEIKTRTIWDWEKYRNRSILKQIDRYRDRGINIVYVWVTYDKNNNKVFISGFNYLLDFRDVFMDGKDYCSSGYVIRDFNELIRLCFKSQNNEVKKHVLYKKANYIGRKSNQIRKILPPRKRKKKTFRSTSGLESEESSSSKSADS